MNGNVRYTGFNIGDVLMIVITAVFVTLKLCGVIAWSWVWVLSPLWIGLILAIIAGIAIAIILRKVWKDDDNLSDLFDTMASFFGGKK